jgi:hypothetical protein
VMDIVRDSCLPIMATVGVFPMLCRSPAARPAEATSEAPPIDIWAQARAARTCPACFSENKTDAESCAACGAALSSAGAEKGSSAAPSAAAPPAAAEAAEPAPPVSGAWHACKSHATPRSRAPLAAPPSRVGCWLDRKTSGPKLRPA